MAPCVLSRAGEEVAACRAGGGAPCGLRRAGEEASARLVDPYGRRHTGDEAVCGHRAGKDSEDPHITSPNHGFFCIADMFLCHYINVSMLVR